MRTRHLVMLAVLFALVAGASAVPAASPVDAQKLDADLADAIRAYVVREMEGLGVPGAAVAVVHRDAVVFAEGFGRADPDGRAPTPQTPFDLASVSKSLTAIAAMQQVEAGNLELDAPVQRYLPWYGAEQPALAPVTVRDLLGHQSGWTILDGQANLADEYDGTDAIERNVRRLAATAPTNPRGTFEYSNANYDVLAHLVEVTSDMPFGEYIETNLFAPLEMGHAHTTRAAAEADGMAQGFVPFFGIAAPYEVPFVPGGLGSGFLAASAEDLGHALIFHLNRGRYGSNQVLAPELVDELHRPIGQPEPAAGYGGGLWISPLYSAGGLDGDGGAITYRAPILLEHGGDHASTATSILLLPEHEWGVAVLFNLNDSAATSRFHQLHFGIAHLLLGLDPQPSQAYEDPLAQNVRLILVVVIVLQVVGVIWAFHRVRNWQRRPESRPRGWPRRALQLGPPVLLDIGVPAAFWWLFLDRGGPHLAVTARYLPDAMLALVLITVLGVGWGFVRTILSVRHLRHD